VWSRFKFCHPARSEGPGGRVTHSDGQRTAHTPRSNEPRCHPQRSKGSLCQNGGSGQKILRCAQDDTQVHPRFTGVCAVRWLGMTRCVMIAPSADCARLRSRST
jgi:hypothetical protein